MYGCDRAPASPTTVMDLPDENDLGKSSSSELDDLNYDVNGLSIHHVHGKFEFATSPLTRRCIYIGKCR